MMEYIKYFTDFHAFSPVTEFVMAYGDDKLPNQPDHPMEASKEIKHSTRQALNLWDDHKKLRH